MEVEAAGEQASPSGGVRRLGLITIDQGISSLSNVLTAVLAARVLGARSFGFFAVVLLGYITVSGFTRSLLGEPLLVRPEEAEERPGEAIGTALVVGAGLGILVGVAALAVAPANGELAQALAVLAVCTPFLLCQDLGRYLGFALHRPARSLALDLLWLGLLVVAVVALAVAGAQTLTWFVVAWAGTGALSSSLLFWNHRSSRLVIGIGWLRETWSIAWRYAVSFGARQGSVLIASSFLVGVLGAKALGAGQGALLLFGPQVQLQAAIVAAGVAEVARMRPEDDAIRRHLVRATVITTAVAVINLLVLLVLPDSLGRAVLGDTWAATKPLLLPAGLQFVLLGMVSGTRSTILGFRQVSRALRVDIVNSSGNFIATVIGALLWDIKGVLWLLVVEQVGVTVLWWAMYRSARRSAVLEPST
jgi:O-antigen/teichoic acid export membrane protein